ncbi:hypothetical protein [Rhizobium leguminosarum]|nr:hypothetical protein [Rhizobium leguminosarum]ASS57570.1 hypothetical protein CHR56_25130 [Rhizobium leguminosarum bv. viciae]TBY17508.1 hypothetical protein E0H30_26165 [Rhizobium leguminosarum bv. viciae]TBY24603.1 hypothetical protein E0H37_23055 [Rhizobium leguminosarum bv. viciae]TBY99733.1 hypothetical protein E0H49_17625 [Rhizobium leguminosarum bv. viciae]TBZ84246.1 hypothetical protein E0H53_22335 [Rhizobium leguminosarum bv. viciae]
MAENANTIWADGPSISPEQPEKSRIRAWGTWLESFITAIGANSGSVFQTRALLFADLAHAANSMAWVVGDPSVAYNGIYQKIGISGFGSWTRVGDLPYSFNAAFDVGAGTANAIQATTSVPVSSAQIIVVTIFEANTGTPVTISFNGGSALTVKNFLGEDLVANELLAGAVVTGVISGSTFRLLYDQKYPYAKAVNSGAGTANAIVATIPVGVDFSDSNNLIGLPIVATNTATPVTVAFNGGSALTIKTMAGNNPVVGGLPAGVTLLGFVTGGTFRLLSDQASAAVLAAAEAAAALAADYADFARNNWVVNGPFTGTGAEADYLLSIDPGSANNMFVVVGGVNQMSSDIAYTLVYSGSDAYIRINVPLGVKFEVRVSNAIPIGTPSDGTVTTPKLGAKAVTYPKIQDVSATLRLLGRASAGAGVMEELTVAQIRDLFFPIGSVIDSVTAVYTTNADLTTVIPADDTIPQIGEGTQILSVAITPKSASNKLRIRFVGEASPAAGPQALIWAIFDGSAGAIAAGHVSGLTTANGYQMSGEVEVTAGSTSAKTFSVRVGAGAGTMRMNGASSGRLFGGVCGTRLVVEEVKG